MSNDAASAARETHVASRSPFLHALLNTGILLAIAAVAWAVFLRDDDVLLFAWIPLIFAAVGWYVHGLLLRVFPPRSRWGAALRAIAAAYVGLGVGLFLLSPGAPQLLFGGLLMFTAFGGFVVVGAVAMLTWPLLGIRSPHRRDPLAEDEPPYPV
ncbi:hypothetical protein [Microbacterium aurantiacum]|uniref:Uncharacterized protein n=1 Tax=Microbacterium aurantiacum TaxID=162393 RepID=A0A0M9VL75_9MICO|nr:hypothetical protein [Microbacterium chocolatum]ANG86213.1 hypothetical protein A8L33_13330 [Microbacterium chocolatum]KOS10883.1 hypothetical protein XI38_08825 [Microbacterium chocolatum]